jgi:hypothetical protein
VLKGCYFFFLLLFFFSEHHALGIEVVFEHFNGGHQCALFSLSAGFLLVEDLFKVRYVFVSVVESD